jgi:hypothetical protein
MKPYVQLVLLLILASGCKDDETSITVNDSDTTLTNFVLVAGQTIHDSILYRAYNPSIIIKGQRVGTDSNYYYHDSLDVDLDSDGINDINFRYIEEFYQPSCNCDEIDCCMPSGYMISSIKRLSNIELAVIHDELYDMTLLDRLEFGDTIKNHTLWDNSSLRRIITAWGLETPWNIDYFNSFIGIRFITNRDTLYGWIRMNTYNSNKIEIFDYALEITSH